MKKITFAFAIFLLFLASPGYTNSPPNIGDQIPYDLAAFDQDGELQDFDTLKGERGLVIFFVRSLDWCPYCQNQIMEVNEEKSRFTKAGYNVISISYDPVETLKRFSNQRDIQLTMLSDPDSKIIQEFGILNQSQEPGSRFYGIPYPTIYVVNTDGVINEILAEEGYKNRPELDDVLNALD